MIVDYITIRISLFDAVYETNEWRLEVSRILSHIFKERMIDILKIKPSNNFIPENVMKPFSSLRSNMR